MTGNPHTCLCFPYLHGYGFCMCSCVCMHMCPGYTQASVHLHVEARGRRCLLQSHLTFLRLHLSLTGWPESPGAHLCLCIPNTGVTGIVCSSLLFCVRLGIGTQALVFVPVLLGTKPSSQFSSCPLNSHLKYMSRAGKRA